MTKYVVDHYMKDFMPMGFDNLEERVSRLADWYLPTIIQDGQKKYDETDGREGRNFVLRNVRDVGNVRDLNVPDLELHLQTKGTNFKTAKLCQYAVDQSNVRT